MTDIKEGLCPFKRVLEEGQWENYRDEGQMARRRDGSEVGEDQRAGCFSDLAVGKPSASGRTWESWVRAVHPAPGPSQWSTAPPSARTGTQSSLPERQWERNRKSMGCGVRQV